MTESRIEDLEDARSFEDLIRKAGLDAEVVAGLDAEVVVVIRCAASYHEAGHAVVAWKLGVEVVGVDMTGDDTCLALVERRSAEWTAEQAGGDQTAIARGRYTDVMVAFAGALAHTLAGFTDDYVDADYAGDILSARIFAVKLARVEAGLPAMLESRYLGPSDPLYPAVRVIAERAQKETITLLQDNWQAVERVAGVLAKRDRLTAAELEHIITHGQCLEGELVSLRD